MKRCEVSAPCKAEQGGQHGVNDAFGFAFIDLEKSKGAKSK